MPGMRIDSTYGEVPCPDHLPGCLVIHWGWIVDTVILWSAYWRIDTVGWDGYLTVDSGYIDIPILDTTWRPRVPREGDK